MVCDLKDRLAISEASVGRKKSCSQLSLEVGGWVGSGRPYAISNGPVLVAPARCLTTDEVHFSVC